PVEPEAPEPAQAWTDEGTAAAAAPSTGLDGETEPPAAAEAVSWAGVEAPVGEAGPGEPHAAVEPPASVDAAVEPPASAAAAPEFGDPEEIVTWHAAGPADAGAHAPAAAAPDAPGGGGGEAADAPAA